MVGRPQCRDRVDIDDIGELNLPAGRRIEGRMSGGALDGSALESAGALGVVSLVEEHGVDVAVVEDLEIRVAAAVLVHVLAGGAPVVHQGDQVVADRRADDRVVGLGWDRDVDLTDRVAVGRYRSVAVLPVPLTAHLVAQ